ncbi:MAG: Gfo/Idh/MocA family oxidoreductase [Ruminococcaceae bacterium]|nr:Gfo/Idh/MocA family oxidoreductase [Oscillospiraceae bacterium]
MIKAAIIGFAHMHVNEVALYISEQPDTELVAVADAPTGVEQIAPLRYTPAWNKQNVCENYCSNYYDSYTEMLDKEKPEMVYILTENCKKPEVVEECAKRHINVCIEKPIAVSFEEAQRIEKAVKESGITAVVNWPVVWRPYIHKMKKALDEKIVGDPIKLRYINGHTGPLGKGAKHRGVSAKAEEMTDEQRAKTWWHNDVYGGGVFLDICCYGCFFSKWFMGEGEKSVLSYGANLNTPYGDTEDNFAAIVKYDGKMSVIEGTWTTPRAVIPSGPMVLCTGGVINCTGGAENAPDVECYDIYGNLVEMPALDELGDKYKNMPCHYANHIKTGEPIHEMLSLDANMRVMAILDAAIKSSRGGSEAKILD